LFIRGELMNGGLTGATESEPCSWKRHPVRITSDNDAATEGTTPQIAVWLDDVSLAIDGAAERQIGARLWKRSGGRSTSHDAHHADENSQKRPSTTARHEPQLYDLPMSFSVVVKLD
jgi:hypothetical protein